MNALHDFDEAILLRCVHGELSLEQQVALIQKLEVTSNEAGWRLLCLRFLEHQALETFFRSELDPPEASLSKELPVELAVASRQSLTVVSPRRSSRVSAPSLVATAVLGMLLGFGIAMNFRNPDVNGLASRDVREFSSSEAGAYPTNRVVDTPGRALGTNRPAGGDVHYADMHHVVPMELPAAEMYYREVLLPEEVQRQLRRMGYAIERRSRAYKLPLDNGREVIVPSDTMHIRYVNN